MYVIIQNASVKNALVTPVIAPKVIRVRRTVSSHYKYFT
jgi:hypothetical protein